MERTPSFTFFSWCLSYAMRPKTNTQDAGKSIMEQSSARLVRMVGFSSGVAELAPKKPPPFVPKCLIDSSAAIGPLAISCNFPSKVVTVILEAKFCGTPCQTRNKPTKKDIGNKKRVMMRMKSTQKFPIGFPNKPRIIAIHAAQPLAAEVNIIIIITNICDK